MATIDRKTNAKKSAVDASCEIVFDALYMTSDILHSIRNNLPVSLEAAQVIERRPRPDAAALVAVPVGVRRALVALLGIVAITVGIVQIAEALGPFPAAPSSAKTVTHSAPATPGERARQLLDDGQPVEALAAVEFAAAQGIVDAELREIRIEALLATGDYRSARTEALRAAADGLGARFVSHYRTSLANDPALTVAARPLELDAAQGIEQTDDKLVLTVDGVARTLEVARVDNNDWAAQLSAARLCVVIDCAFDVPQTEHVTLTRSDAHRLGLDEETLAWRYSGDANGELVELADASLTEQVAATGRFPIEVTRTWRNVLSVSVDESYVDAPFAATIQPLAGMDGWAASVLGERGDADSRTLGRQIGSMIAFDFLTNHYGRFASDEADYGARVAWVDGHIVSHDHAGLFAERSSRRVRDRFRWMTRMPAETATAIRIMAPELVDDKVLVGLNDRQREVFWSQRDAFVDRLEQLEGEHGRSRVLAL